MPAKLDPREHHRERVKQGEGREEPAYYVILFMPDIPADHLRQAASWVSLKFRNEVVLEGTIKRWPRHFQYESCLTVGIDETNSTGGGSQRRGMPNFITRASSKRVDVSFILKHSYFNSLRKALCLLPPHMVDRLVPNERTLKTRRIIETAADVDYPVLDQFDLDEEYQEPACSRILQSSTSAPFLITGPFGAGKTRLLATIALRILLRNPNCFILISTHLIKTADQYIEKYFEPFLEVDNFKMKKNLKVVRVVGNDPFYDSESKDNPQPTTLKANPQSRYTKIVSNMDQETVGNCNLIVTTFGVMLKLRRVLKDHNCPFFTHIFIDEGAQARESETLGAFSHAGHDTKIVIAGDHKQVLCIVGCVCGRKCACACMCVCACLPLCLCCSGCGYM